MERIFPFLGGGVGVNSSSCSVNEEVFKENIVKRCLNDLFIFN